MNMEGYNTIDIQKLQVTPQDEDNTYIGIDENGNMVRTKIEINPSEVDIDLTGYATEEWVTEQGYIKNIPFSNWNAKKGEEGYIENRTHYRTLSEKQFTFDGNDIYIQFYIKDDGITIMENLYVGICMFVQMSNTLGESLIVISTEQYKELKKGNTVQVTATFEDKNILFNVYMSDHPDLTMNTIVITFQAVDELDNNFLEGTYTLQYGELKILDDVYISNNIARKSDIENIVGDINNILETI